MSDKQETFFVGLAEIFELEDGEVNAELDLSTVAWDSLAIVSVIALADDTYGVFLEGEKLKACSTVADIVALVQ